MLLIVLGCLCILGVHQSQTANAQTHTLYGTEVKVPVWGTMSERFFARPDDSLGLDIIYIVDLYDSTAAAFLQEQALPVYESMCVAPWDAEDLADWDFGDVDLSQVDTLLLQAWKASLQLLIMDCYDSLRVEIETWVPHMLEPYDFGDERVVVVRQKHFFTKYGIIQVNFTVCRQGQADQQKTPRTSKT